MGHARRTAFGLHYEASKLRHKRYTPQLAAKLERREGARRVALSPWRFRGRPVGARVSRRRVASEVPLQVEACPLGHQQRIAYHADAVFAGLKKF